MQGSSHFEGGEKAALFQARQITGLTEAHERGEAF
jgi:hypothetical protein